MKKFVSAALCAVLALALAACGGPDAPSSYSVEVVGPARTSAPAPTPAPAGSEPAAAGWAVAPRKDITVTQSLADFAKPQRTQLAQQDQLAFFEQNDMTGVIDLEGNIRIPAEKNVHWCPVCGITNGDESEIYEQDGTVVGSGGHGSTGSVVYYDTASRTAYVEDMGWLFAWDEVQVPTNQPFIATAVTITEKQGQGEADDLYLNATGAAVTVSGRQGDVILMPDGTPLDGVVYEQVNAASEGLFAAKMGGAWGYVNATTGRQAVPFVYLQALPFHEGLAAVQSQTGWGYVAADGTEKTAMTFLHAQSATGGKAWVETADGWGVAILDEWPA